MDSSKLVVGRGTTAGIVGRKTARGGEVREQIRFANARELADTLQGITWTHSQLLLQAQDFLRTKGMRRPSPSDVSVLAEYTRRELESRV